MQGSGGNIDKQPGDAEIGKIGWIRQHEIEGVVGDAAAVAVEGDRDG